MRLGRFVRRSSVFYMTMVAAAALSVCCVSTGGVRATAYGEPFMADGVVFAVAPVEVEAGADSDSIEREIEGLAPLLLEDRGFAVAGKGQLYDYAVFITAVEREYVDSFTPRRSIRLVIEVVARGDAEAALAACALASEPATLASSVSLERLLDAAIASLARRLRA